MTYYVRGLSLVPLIKPGDRIDAVPVSCLEGQPEHGWLIILRSGGSENPLVKIIKAVPGDRFTLVPAQETGAQHLEINGVTAANSEGVPYRFHGNRARMIGIYESGYDGVIPEGAFLVLGDDPHGSLDAGKIGLIHISDVIAVAPPP